MRRAWWLAPVLVAACAHPSPGPGSPAAASPPERCAPTTTPGAELLQAFRNELWRQAGQDPTGFLFAFPETVAAFARDHRAVLAGEARVRFLAIPRLDVPDLDAWPEDPRATGDVAERMREVVAGGPADGGAAASQAQLVGLPTNLLDRFAWARGFALGWGTPGSGRFHDRLVEVFVAPRVVRLNDDPAHPILAMPRRDDLFVVWFDQQDDGAVVRRMRWARRPTPAEPDPDPRTTEQVQRAFSLAMEGVAVPKNLRPQELNAYLTERSEAMRARWLQPHRDLLRRSGACAFQRLPLQPPPDLTTWQDQSHLWTPADFTLPSQTWDPTTVFAAVRTFMAVRSQPVSAFTLNAIFDQVAPPLITRANDDPDHPVLSQVDRGTALLVTLRISEVRGYAVESVKYARQPR